MFFIFQVTFNLDPATHNLGGGATDRMVTLVGNVAAVEEAMIFVNDMVLFNLMKIHDFTVLYRRFMLLDTLPDQ